MSRETLHGLNTNTLIGNTDARGVAVHSLTEQIDSSTPGGRLTFHLFASLAEFERDLIRERPKAGLEAARARGRTRGRPTAMTPEKLAAAQAMRASGGTTSPRSPGCWVAAGHRCTEVWPRRPSDSGTSVRVFPPSDGTGTGCDAGSSFSPSRGSP